MIMNNVLAVYSKNITGTFQIIDMGDTNNEA